MGNPAKISKEMLKGREEVDEFERRVVKEYLKYGSVDEIFRANNYDLPVSYPGVYHILDRWGVVRAIGRANTPLSECIGFLVRMVEERIPLETLYKRMPPSFTPSMTTAHTIYRKVKSEVKKQIGKRDMRRVGTALVVTTRANPNTFLVGRDVSAPGLDVGKPYGAVSLPMGFSKRGENKKAALRVLQQEVFSKLLLDNPQAFGRFAEGLLEDVSPYMFLDIADVRVSAYHLVLPEDFTDTGLFSSFKLKNYKFVSVEDVMRMKKDRNLLREGIFEIATGFADYRKQVTAARVGETYRPFYKTAFLNQKIKLLSSQELSQEGA